MAEHQLQQQHNPNDSDPGQGETTEARFNAIIVRVGAHETWVPLHSQRDETQQNLPPASELNMKPAPASAPNPTQQVSFPIPHP